MIGGIIFDDHLLGPKWTHVKIPIPWVCNVNGYLFEGWAWLFGWFYLITLINVNDRCETKCSLNSLSKITLTSLKNIW
jgi:hypothetical protein